ncbi:MAG: TIM barrel protein, partial [Candidatus Aenigmatarchaeota archaeon]
MLYGKNVWYGERPLEKTFETAKNIGFDLVEISIDYPWPEKNSKKDFQILKNIRKDFGLEIAFHAPWIGICLAHPQKEIFDASLKILKKAMIFSEKFNPLYFTFHIIAPFHGTFKLENISKEVLRKGLEAAFEISNLAKKLGLNICIENNPEIFFGSPGQIEKVLNKCENLKFNFDISHAIVAK